MVTRTWQEVMEELTRNKRGSTQERYARAIEDRAFDPIRELPVMESRSEHFLKVLANQQRPPRLRSASATDCPPFDSTKGRWSPWARPPRCSDLGHRLAQGKDQTPSSSAILEAAGLRVPTSVHGVEQRPMDGASMLYTFDAPARTVAEIKIDQLVDFGFRSVCAVRRHEVA